MRLPVTPFLSGFKPISTRSFFRYTTHIKPTLIISVHCAVSRCAVPPVISKEKHDAKGTYTAIDGMKTTTGQRCRRPILSSIFGFRTRALQGADNSRSQRQGEPSTKVFVPKLLRELRGLFEHQHDYPPDTVSAFRGPHS